MKMMKYSQVVMGLTTAALMLAVLASTSFAQTHLRAEIPFDFYVAGKLLPAGTYTITALPGRGVISVNNAKGNHAMVTTIPAASRLGTQSRYRGKNLVLFNRYGSLNFLSQLHWAEFEDGRSIGESKLELEARKSGNSREVAITLPQ